MSLAPGAAGFIKTMLGEDMNLVRNELSKISLYVDGKKSIGEKDLAGAYGETEHGERVFPLNRAFKQGPSKVLSGYFGNLRETGRTPFPYST